MTTPDKGLVTARGANDMSRLTPEREAVIRQRISEGEFDFQSGYMESVIAEIDALRRERDEAIVGAASVAERMRKEAECVLRPPEVVNAKTWASPLLFWAGELERVVPPQSALDVVERDRREIAEMGIEIGKNYGAQEHAYEEGCSEESPGPEPTADDVLAKVGGKR